ncbi:MULTISPECIES: HAD family hydrolase [unclassified Corynebacterium]|uniref:HAD family hydrolase n=1 Tax=unclassified Corynebacterium TaxID=2624378 RepID=UPI0034CE5A43
MPLPSESHLDQAATTPGVTGFPARPRAIFWDMDGTLTDSEPLWAEATFYLSETLGKRLTPTERLATVGSTFATTLEICAAKAGVTLTEEDYPKYRKLMFSKVRELFAGNLEVFDGVRGLLRELHADGMPMLVTTNTERYVADGAIAAIGPEFFHDTICGDEVPTGKPAPDMYLQAARSVGADPQECLVFEDSTAGMTAAVEAGCRVIGLPEDDHVAVPDGVVQISQLHGHRHLAPAGAADVYAWWQQITAYRG